METEVKFPLTLAPPSDAIEDQMAAFCALLEGFPEDLFNAFTDCALGLIKRMQIEFVPGDDVTALGARTGRLVLTFPGFAELFAAANAARVADLANRNIAHVEAP